MEKEEELAKRAFNSGFLIAQHDPELFKQIAKSFAHNENNKYLAAFKKGVLEFEKQKELQNPVNNKPKNQNIEKDR